ncbi:MAG: hypothetical protein V1726_08785 [Methanobacteriota archaeon]
MVTISHVVQKLVNDQMCVLESIDQGIISYSALAKKLQPDIENELGKKIKTHAIIMALHRYEEKLKQKHTPITFDYHSEIILKTDICDISVRRSLTLFDTLKKLYDIVHFEDGDLLNIVHGRCEVSIVTNERYRRQTLDFLKKEHIINVEKNLVCLTLTFPKEYLRTPGVIFQIARSLAWDNINIFEIVSTNTELSLIIAKTDAIKGYTTLEKMMQTTP